MICIDAEQLQDGLYNIKDGKIFKYKAKGGTARAYKLENRPQEWIPCDKELPTLMTDVLGTDKYGHIRHVYRATRHGKSRFETVEEGMGINILAWMPLPKPWKGADDE